MKPWIASLMVLSVIALLAYVSSTVNGSRGSRGGGRGGSNTAHNERLLRQSAAFLQKSKQVTDNHVATLVHAARARVLAAAVVPATPESRSLVSESQDRESLAASIVKRRAHNDPAEAAAEPVNAAAGFTPMNFAGKGF